MSPRHAALTLLGLAALGHLAIRWRARPELAPGELLVAPRAAISPSAQRDSALRAARPLGATERIDLDHATARELERLPGVGPGLAARIVADRAAHGPFGGLAGLDRVSGVGPALLGRIGPHAAFSGAPAAPSDSTTVLAGIHLQPGEAPLGGPAAPSSIPVKGHRAKKR